jgi:DNA-directed RNA polymerase subunit RPC12/RpoP
MPEESRSVHCGECGASLAEPTDILPEDRLPCPNCGSTRRNFGIVLSTGLSLHSSLGIKGRHEGVKKPFIEQKQGADLQHSTGRMVQKERILDRENDQYRERVVDPLTGEVIHECQEPLSSHTNHGSAKK